MDVLCVLVHRYMGAAQSFTLLLLSGQAGEVYTHLARHAVLSGGLLGFLHRSSTMIIISSVVMCTRVLYSVCVHQNVA